MAQTVAATASHSFASMSAQEVYDAWLDPEKMRTWGEANLKERDPAAEVTRIEIDPVVGGRFLIADIRNGEESEAWGYYRALEKPHRIVFTWFVTPEEEQEDNSVVTLEIEPRAQGCVATMSHEMSAEWADYIEPTAKAWTGMLRSIEQTFS